MWIRTNVCPSSYALGLYIALAYAVEPWLAPLVQCLRCGPQLALFCTSGQLENKAPAADKCRLAFLTNQCCTYTSGQMLQEGWQVTHGKEFTP
jgi:hypothetical protein